MEIIDNSEYIIGKINADRSAKEKKLRAEVDKQLRDYKKASEQLKEHDELKVESMQVKLQGAHDLIHEQLVLEIESQNIDQVLTQVRKSMNSLSKTQKQKVVKHMLKHIQDKRVKTYHVPKDVTIKGAKSTLKDFAVVGVISKNEELQYTLTDVLKSHELMIRTQVGKAK